MKQVQRITSKAIIEKDGKILCLKDKDFWELPGGKPDFNESLEDALVREVKEETSLDISIKNIVYIWTFTKTREDINEERQHFVIVYLAESNSNEVVLSSEHEGFEWIPFDKIGSLHMREGYKEAIQRYFHKTH